MTAARTVGWPGGGPVLGESRWPECVALGRLGPPVHPRRMLGDVEGSQPHAPVGELFGLQTAGGSDGEVSRR